MKNRPIQTKQEPAMGYEAFKRALQDKIQDCVARPVNFMETESVRINETSEGLILKLDGGNTAPLIYPEKLYEDYLAGMPLSMIAADAADTVKKTYEYPIIPDLTPENARKHIRFALINRERNQKLLETCPYKEVLDLAAVPRWYMDKGSFLVDNGILQILRMRQGKRFSPSAQSNTESEQYVCKSIYDMICDTILAEGTGAELLDRLRPAGKSQLYVLTNRTGTDGSRAVLSDCFMQEVARQLGTDELCLVPSSRNEMIADVMTDADVSERLKQILYSVNRDPAAMQPCEILSDSAYTYNAKHICCLYILQRQRRNSFSYQATYRVA